MVDRYCSDYTMNSPAHTEGRAMQTDLKDETTMHDLRITGQRLPCGDKMTEHNDLVILVNGGQPVQGVEVASASNRCSSKVSRPSCFLHHCVMPYSTMNSVVQCTSHLTI